MTRARTLRRSIAAAPHLVWSVLFIVAPLLFVFYYAFTDKDGAFSFTNIADLFTADYVTIFVRSLSFAVIATFLCLLIGYPLAWCISRMKKHTQGILIMLVMLPLWMNLLIRTYCWMNLLETNGLINALLGTEWKMLGTSGAVILGMVYDFLPYMVLPIYTSMSKLDNRYLEAAADLGCNGFQTMFRVILPLTLPGVISGITMVFVPSISTFYISQKLGGGNFDLIGDTIERQFKVPSTYHVGAAISLVMMILILISTAVMNHFSDREGKETAV